MKRKIWKMRQEIGAKKWFVFLDTDTYIDWDNILELLGHHDAGDRIYMGSPVWLPKMPFAHGGSAYVLSYGALEAMNKASGSGDPKQPLYSQFGLNTTALCCGDEALARVLKPKGVHLKGYWPMFNGEVPATLSFGRDLWCEPVISLHHLGGEEMQSLWDWVEDWKHTHSVSRMSVCSREALRSQDRSNRFCSRIYFDTSAPISATPSRDGIVYKKT